MADAETPSENPAPTPPTEAPIKVVERTPAFRLGLLKKLPKLGYTAWTAKDNLRIDVEWNNVVNVRADALLGPLEPLVPENLR